MGQILHGCATTTEAVRRAIQDSQESLRVLARRYGINPKTVAKWKKRGFVRDLPTGPKEPRSTVLSVVVGNGPQKVAPLRAALTGRLASALITDEATATALMADAP